MTPLGANLKTTSPPFPSLSPLPPLPSRFPPPLPFAITPAVTRGGRSCQLHIGRTYVASLETSALVIKSQHTEHHRRENAYYSSDAFNRNKYLCNATTRTRAWANNAYRTDTTFADRIPFQPLFLHLSCGTHSYFTERDKGRVCHTI